jgi:hypothetical protein
VETEEGGRGKLHIEKWTDYSRSASPGVRSRRSFRWDETESLNCDHQPAYCSSPRTYEYGESRFKDVDRGNRRRQRTTRPNATSSTTNPTWADPSANPGLRGERPVTNDLSYGTASPDDTSMIHQRSVRWAEHVARIKIVSS